MKTAPIIHFTQNATDAAQIRDYSEGKLAVSSIFRTLQGEGPYTGHPAVFLRLAGCNFGTKTAMCQFCDTKFDLESSVTCEIPELVEHLYRLLRPKDILVVTGGEPTLQFALIDLLKALDPTKLKAVQIETNGSRAAFFIKYGEERSKISVPVSVVVSPKASYVSGKYPPPSFVVLEHASCLKFVLDANPDSPHHTVPAWALTYDHFPVYVSPMAEYLKAYSGEVSSIWDSTLINQEKTSLNYAYAAKYAIDNDLLLSTQTHLFTAIP